MNSRFRRARSLKMGAMLVNINIDVLIDGVFY